MYFDYKPKENVKDLFGTDVILKKFKTALLNKNNRLIVIKGLRRTGKTSLLNVVLKESNLNYIKIDVRSTPFFDYFEFITEFKDRLNVLLNDSIIKKIKDKIDSVDMSIGYKDMKTGLKLNIKKDKTITTYLDEINKLYEKKKQQFIIAIDEAHLLKDIKMDYIFASIYDNYPNIKMIFTGSEIGLLNDFLGESNYDAPLYGRLFETIETKKLHQQESYEFLKKGFSQVNIKYDENDLIAVIDNFDGIIGWHTQYGSERINGKTHSEALEKVKSYGAELNKREFENFLKTRKNKQSYIKIMRCVKNNSNSWTEIKYSFSKSGSKITDSQLSLYLSFLVKYGFIEEKNGKYIFTDPLLMLAVK